MDENLDIAVNDILSQLKREAAKPKEVVAEESLSKDQLEEFIIKNSGKLVKQSLEIVDNVNDYVSTAPEAKDVSALAELIGAASSAIESLNKIYISSEKNKTAIHVKQMDIESRERMNIVDNQTKMLLSREDIMKALVSGEDDSKLIDI